MTTILRAARDWLTARRWFVVAVPGMLLGTFWAGVRHQRATDATAHYAAARAALVDTVRVLDVRIHHDTVRVAATAHAADSSRRAFRRADSTFAAHVHILSDSEVSVDGAPATATVPAALVIPDLRLCRSAVPSDSAAYAALAQLLQDQAAKTVAETHRADLAEHELARCKGSRFGIKTGLALGAGLAALLVHVLR